MNDKSYFIVSTHNPALSKESSLFIADPFFKHLIDINPDLAPNAQLHIGSFIRNGPEDLYAANCLVWSKCKKYIPILSDLLNKIHDTKFSEDFWRRAFSMGLVRHLTFMYDFFMICETHFNQADHGAYKLSTDCLYVPVDYNEQRWFLQHSHFGQEQLFSMYLNLFYPGYGLSYSNTYTSSYKVNRFITRTSDYNPSVGIMGCLFDESLLHNLIVRSKRTIAPIGFDFNLPARPSISYAKRTKLKYFDNSFDRFDKFFFGTLSFMLPQEFVENFELVYTSASNQFDRYTNLKYVVSETFIGETYESMALAILKDRGVTIVYSEHNYCEYPCYSSILEQQSSFADIFAAHGNYFAPIKGKVSTGSLFPFYEKPLAQDKIIFDILYVCGVAEAKYPYFSHTFMLTAEHALIHYDFKLRFFKSLSENVLKKILYRSYPSESQWALIYDDNFIMNNVLTSMRNDDRSANSRTRMRESRLIITDYLGTTYLESMSMNIPTVVFYKKNSYFLNDDSKNFLDELYNVGICQDDPEKAAKFIEQISLDPEGWWFQSDVQAAKDRFLEKNLGKPEYLTNFLFALAAGNAEINYDKLHIDGERMKIPLTSFKYDENLRVLLKYQNDSTDFAYSDGNKVEEKIYRMLKETGDLGIYSRELCSRITDWPTEYHFSPIRHNLLRHICFKPTDRVLELGCGCGAITRQIGESGANTTAIEGSLLRARCAAERCRDLPNVKVYCSNFQDIEFIEQYDLVTLIGVLEYSPQYFTSQDPIRECLEIALKALKEDGVLIIAIENQLGLKYFNGFREDHVGIPYFGIEDRYSEKTAITFGRKELADILRGMGFNNVEFHYPFPDYKVPKAVFSEKAFRDDLFCPEEIIRQIASRDYSGELIPAFHEQLAVPALCKNGVMEDLSNSFLVIATRERNSMDSFRNPDLLARVYTTERNNAFNILTEFTREGKGILVRKCLLRTGSSPASPKDFLFHRLVTENYQAGRNLEAEYRKCLLLKNFDELFILFQEQLEYVVSHAILASCKDNPVRSRIRPEFVDCVPSNLILREGRLHYIDREWEALKPVTLGALLLRSVDAIHNLDVNAPELTRENLISMLREVGLNIDTETFREYDEMIREIEAQVYQGAHLGEVGGIPSPSDPLRVEIAEIIRKIAAMSEPTVSLLRFRSHLVELLRVRDGKVSAPNYLERIAGLGRVSTDEVELSRKILNILGKDADWSPVSDVLENIVRDLENEPGLGGKTSGTQPDSSNHQLDSFKSFFYRDEFKNFVCPNPFLYAELHQNGDISCCCYLPFVLGNIREMGIDDIWNSDIAQELRRSILSGEYCYCDKRKCAAMQQARLPIKNGIYDYQLPYQLQRKSDRIDESIQKIVASGALSPVTGPQIISFEDDPTCNLSCPSCRIAVAVLKPEESRMLLDTETRLLDSIGNQLKELWFSGAGDPFASTSYRELFEKYDFDKFSGLRFRFDTNGILLSEKTWNQLPVTIRERVKLIAVSVDAAVESTYSAIRRGGNFTIMMKNLRFISSLPGRKAGMGFIIRMIVQQKNFEEMKLFVEFGRSLNVDSVVFSSLQNWGTFSGLEYLEQAVHLPDHPRHGELLEILRDPVFSDPLVDLGNLTGLWPGMANASSNSERLPRPRIIAFYLPQFHPIPENDAWWGKGFTEWTNVTKAKPLYEGHYQPHLAGDLGYYDLRVPEVSEQQANLAQIYGIEAFCYWHYWFAGKRLLERPFDEVVRSGKPDFPFCLGWANQTWSGIWHGAPNRILIEQTYPGLEDYKAHFETLLPAFRDPRYFRVNGKLLFVIYAPTNLPDARFFTSCWRGLAARNGVVGFHFVAHNVRNPEEYGCDSCVDNAPFTTMNAPLMEVEPTVDGKLPRIYHYGELVRTLKEYVLSPREYPLVVPNWDNTPRSGGNGLVLHGSTPELFKEMVEDAIWKVERVYEPDERIVFVKAWNEWAEGNHLEPDLQFGHRYLEVIRECWNVGSMTKRERV